VQPGKKALSQALDLFLIQKHQIEKRPDIRCREQPVKGLRWRSDRQEQPLGIHGTQEKGPPALRQRPHGGGHQAFQEGGQQQMAIVFHGSQ